MLKRVDVLLINDGEAKMLADDNSLPRAARKVLDLGPRALVIKHGEYGATIFFRDGEFAGGHHPFRAPALPSTRCAIPPERATALPAASWDISRRRMKSTVAC